MTTTWDPWHGPGTVAGSLVNVVRRGTGRGLPWSDALGARDRVDASVAVDMPARHRPKLARRVLDGVSARLARIEALAGAGAVVDVIARVDSPRAG